MFKKILIASAFIILTMQILWASPTVRIGRITGDVKVRMGVEETWEIAKPDMLLKEIDSILTGKNSQVELEDFEGKIFTLGSNAELDIADLRKISEQELFLFLMSRKVKEIEPSGKKTPLRIGNVSVIHGESKIESHTKQSNENLQMEWQLEKNGAKALFKHSYYPNTIIKLHKIADRYSSYDTCGEIHYYLGKSFEALEKNGQAIDAYKIFTEKYRTNSCSSEIDETMYHEARASIKRLTMINDQ